MQGAVEVRLLSTIQAPIYSNSCLNYLLRSLSSAHPQCRRCLHCGFVNSLQLVDFRSLFAVSKYPTDDILTIFPISTVTVHHAASPVLDPPKRPRLLSVTRSIRTRF